MNMHDRIHHLFFRYLNNTCTKKELQEFFDLVQQAKTDDHLRALIKEVYEEIKLTHPSLTYVDEAGNLIVDETERFSYRYIANAGRKKLKWLVPLGIAAMVVFISGIVFLINYKPSHKEGIAREETLTKKFTQRQEEKYLLLQDSSQVWLNAASSLEYPDRFDKKRREVYLTGEAYFDIKHADEVPFVIHTGKVTTTVLGTAFNIKAYPGQKEIIVSVSRGRVKVSRDDKTVATLVKGESIKINNNTEETVQKKVAVEEVAAWQQGNLVYDDIPLEDIVKDLQNVFNVEIKIGDSATAHISVTTTFSRDAGAAGAAKVLSELVNKKLTEKNGVLTIQ